ncbi:Ger(x)C family spore germination protein [Desulfotomaculum defluvii]
MRRIILTLLVLFLLFFQTGCWNAREINELAFVLSLALDKADNGGFTITAQMAKPDTHSKTPSGGGGGVEKERPFWVVSSTGSTIFEAIRNMSSISSRRIFWSHIKLIIIGEDLARDNIYEIFDFFSRNPELRLRTWVAVSPGEAGKLLEVAPMMEREPASFMEKLVERRGLTGKGYGIMLKDFLQDYLEPGIFPVASRIVLANNEDRSTLRLSGAAVFGPNKLAGWLGERETRGLLWLNNEINNSVMVVQCPYDDLPVTLEIKKGTTSIKSNFKNGKPYYVIQVDARGNLTEKACMTDFTDPQALEGLEEALATAIHDDIVNTIKNAQSLGVDYTGLGLALHRQHKEVWHKLEKNWTQIFPDAEVVVFVKADIPQLGLLGKPLSPITAPNEKNPEMGE